MPHTTFRYPFEAKMLEAVVKKIGRDDLRALAEPGGEFATTPISERRLSELKDSLPARVFYDPFEPMEYRWLEWQKLSRALAESWLGVRLAPDDFRDFRGEEVLPEFPEDWGVMF
jgi:hypothetical protein